MAQVHGCHLHGIRVSKRPNDAKTCESRLGSERSALDEPRFCVNGTPIEFGRRKCPEVFTKTHRPGSLNEEPTPRTEQFAKIRGIRVQETLDSSGALTTSTLLAEFPKEPNLAHPSLATALSGHSHS